MLNRRLALAAILPTLSVAMPRVANVLATYLGGRAVFQKPLP